MLCMALDNIQCPLVVALVLPITIEVAFKAFSTAPVVTLLDQSVTCTWSGALSIRRYQE